MSSKRSIAIAGLLVGDELGLIKKITLKSNPSMEDVVTLNRDLIDAPTPDQAILSIRPFRTQTIATSEDVDTDEDDACDTLDSRSRKPKVADALNAESSVFFLIASKPRKIQVYNTMTNLFVPVPLVQASNPTACNPTAKLVGAAPYNRNNIVVVFDNGTIITQNIEKEMLQSSGTTKQKAIKILGLDFSNTSNSLNSKPADLVAKRRRKKKLKSSNEESVNGESEGVNDLDRVQKKGTLNENETNRTDFFAQSGAIVFSPNWKVSSHSVTCFQVCGGKVAIGGKNIDLKVFDLTTKQCIFTGKPGKTGRSDRLFVPTPTWVSGIAWIGPVSSGKGPRLFHSKFTPTPSPSLVATCSRSDSIIRIYNVRGKQKTPIWTIDLSKSTFNNDSNPPSFTSITASSSPTPCAVITQQLLLGTTMGRLIAVDLRYNSRSQRVLGVFKGFGGGSVKDITFVPHSGGFNNHRIVSCSLDRFVRVHSFRLGADPKRQLECKYYIKTRPTCLQPIITSFLVEEHVSDLECGEEEEEDEEEEEESEREEEQKIHEETDDENHSHGDEEGSDIDLNDFAETKLDVSMISS